jgi:hypothetical protein
MGPTNPLNIVQDAVPQTHGSTNGYMQGYTFKLTSNHFSLSVVPSDPRNWLPSSGLAQQPHLLSFVERPDDRSGLGVVLRGRHGGQDGASVGDADVDILWVGWNGKREVCA